MQFLVKLESEIPSDNAVLSIEAISCLVIVVRKIELAIFASILPQDSLPP